MRLFGSLLRRRCKSRLRPVGNLTRWPTLKPNFVSLRLTAALGGVASCAPVHAGTLVNIQGCGSGASIGAGIDNPFAAVGATVHFDHAGTLPLSAGD